jgi:hypothetical protein
MDSKKSDLASIIRDARPRVRVDGCQIVLGDYLQLIQVGRGINRVAELELISMTFKQLAREENTAVILISSMNKSGEGASLRDEDVYGDEGKGSGQARYDCDIQLHMRLKDERIVCQCPPELQVVENKKTKKPEPRWKNFEIPKCPDCRTYIRRSGVQTGHIDILKARDGERAGRIPILRDQRLRILEVTS